jgi:OmpA-OmpF porin, OOP family
LNFDNYLHVNKSINQKITMKKIFLSAALFFSVEVMLNAQGLYDRVNLGSAINSTVHTDASPCISHDGKRLYFSRKEGSPENYDIYFSDQDANKKWKPAVKINELNNGSDNAVLFEYPDGNRLIIESTINGNGGFFNTSFNGTSWSSPEPLKFESELAWDNQSLSLSTNGKTMIISNKADLYVSFLKENNVWTTPKPITSLNTTKYEYTVYMASDDATLYFSGNGYETMGENDILKTTRLDDTWMNWSKPTPLDKTINSSNWESYFALSAMGDMAIVYSLAEGNGDIFSVQLTAENKPKPVALVTGKVLNGKNNKPLAATITYDFIEQNENAGSANSNAVDGKYSVVLQYGKKYILAAKADNFFAVSDVLDLTSVSTYQEIVRDIKMYPVEVGETIRLQSVFFETNKADLKPDSYSELERLVTALRGQATLKIEIGGHTDDVGSPQANSVLSQSRVNSVVSYLVSKGIDKSRLKGVGYGESKPVAKNDTDENRALNRRVEFTVVSK